MGCGQSKIHLYPRKSKSKANGKKGGHGDSEAETDEEEGHIEDAENRDRDRTEESEENSNKESGESDEEVSVSLLRARNLSLLQSHSQQNFFRMLDKKIEEGPDYDSNSETEIALEEARLNALVQHWESASLTASMCSSASRSLQTTPVRQTPAKQLTTATRALLPTGLPPQVLNSEFLPHPGTPPTSSQLTAGGTLKLTPSKQITIPQMNSGMLHQISVMPQIPLSLNTETSSPNMATVTANTSNALAIMQAPNAQTTPQYMLAIPTGSSPLLGKTGQVSPKRLVDGRLLINTTSPLCSTQQMQPPPPTNPIQQQYITATPPNLQQQQQQTAPLNYVNGGRAPPPTQSAVGMQLAYYGQAATMQQTMQQYSDTITQQQLQQQQQQQQQQQMQQQQYEQTPHSQSQTPSSSTSVGSAAYYGDVMHNAQASMAPNTEYRFPPAISVQRLAPQVQRQLRETQELIKDSCPQLYAAGYGSPGPPPLRNQAAVTARNHPTNRRPTLETQFSQELS
ncbi:AP2-associated protein kinase 1 isoform X3 [Lucilia sericata]|uniref:AP2-associated protein kinase 1 isoform X3 n=1 Tax=Lucilia sericata TaxID=13632 RepID=UPI0018A870FE|nr:AP2-associated protein kinase 1 isoform X3 [Lucilia sericata]